MAYGIELRSDPVRTVAFGGIAVTYNPVGAAILNLTRIIIVQNLTDALLMFSFDGINDHFPLPANGLMILDGTTNRVDDGGFFISKMTRMHVRHLGGAPSSGSVYITAMHARGD